MLPIDGVDVADAREVLARDTELSQLALECGVETAGLMLDRRAYDGFSPSQYWTQLKREFRRLVCDADAAEYKDIRDKAAKARAAGQVLGIPMICAAIASQVGLSTALITPFVALLIDAAAKLGVQAWCANSSPVKASTD